MNTHRTWHYFDETSRRKWQNPETILDRLDLKPGFVFADLGCGDGFFTLPAARLVGPTGKVFGIDTAGQALDKIRAKAETEGLANLELLVGKSEGIIPCHACADVVFFGNVLHDFQDPYRVVKNARKIIKPAGKLFNLDWKKTTTEIGPPLSIRYDEATAMRIIESAGFEVINVDRSGKYHYVITANPI